MQQNGHVHAGVGRGDECAAEPSASASLLLGKQREAVSAAEILLLHRRVGRGKRRLDQDFASDDRGIEQRVNACGGQAVIIRGQAIAFSGHGVNGKAALAQCGDRLVHRRTGYAKLLGQPSAGKVVPRACSSACKTASFTVNSIISIIKMLIPIVNEKRR